MNSPILDTDRFTRTATGFAAEASDLGTGTYVLRNGFGLRSERTGRVVPATAPVPRYDAEGELTHWVSTAVVANIVLEIVIFND